MPKTVKNLGGPGEAHTARIWGTTVVTEQELKDALELEKLKHTTRIDEQSTALTEDLKILQRTMAAHGAVQSGAFYGKAYELRLELYTKLIDGRLADRRDIGRRFPELVMPAYLDQLRSELKTMVDSSGPRILMAMTSMPGLPSHLNQYFQNRLDSDLPALKLRIDTGLKRLELESRLGLDNIPNQVSNITIQNSTIGNFNAGHVAGDLTASVQVLREQGLEQLSEALRDLARAIAESPDLNSSTRQDALEHLSIVATEAAAPAASKKTAVLRTVWSALQGSLQFSANLATALTSAYSVLHGAGLL